MGCWIESINWLQTFSREKKTRRTYFWKSTELNMSPQGIFCKLRKCQSLFGTQAFLQLYCTRQCLQYEVLLFAKFSIAMYTQFVQLTLIVYDHQWKHRDKENEKLERQQNKTKSHSIAICRYFVWSNKTVLKCRLAYHTILEIVFFM